MRHRIAGISWPLKQLMEISSTTSTPAPEPSTGKEAPCMLCHFDRLPDHLAVSIFKHLDKKIIGFLLPQVCKRWSALACAEEIWKDCHLFYDPYMSESNKKIFFKFLNMAPILGGLTLELEYRDGLVFDEQWKGVNPKEISSLEFTYDNMPPNMMFVLLNKLKDSVTKLIISDTYTPYVEPDVKKLWNHIQNLSKLLHLTIDGAGLLEYKATLKKDAPCWKSLKVLDVKDCSYEDMNTVQRVVSHNLNWTEVYLGSCNSKDFRGEVRALSKCCNLDTIQIPFCREIKLLDNCKNLDSLIIDCVKETVKEVKGIVTLMNKTTYFPKLSKFKMIGAEDEYVNLLNCIVKTHQDISHLNLVSCNLSSSEVRKVLGCLGNLEKLYLHEMDNMIIVAIVNEIMKGKLLKLKEVNVYECYCDNIEYCAKRALDQLQEHHRSIHVVTGSVECSCKPVGATQTKGSKKRKQSFGHSLEDKKMKMANSNNNSSKENAETNKIDNART